MEKKKPTLDLSKMMGKTVNFSEYCLYAASDMYDKKPHVYLNELLVRQGMTINEIKKASGIGEYCYRIFTGNRVPSRNVLLRILIAMKLSVDDVQEMLRVFGIARLDYRVRRDAAVLFAIEKGLSVDEACDLLSSVEEATI